MYGGPELEWAVRVHCGGAPLESSLTGHVWWAGIGMGSEGALLGRASRFQFDRICMVGPNWNGQ